MQTTNYIAHLHRRMPVIFFFSCLFGFFRKRCLFQELWWWTTSTETSNHFTGWSGWNEWTPGWLVLNSPHTPLKFNSLPLKIGNSQKETHLPTLIFQGLCLISGGLFLLVDTDTCRFR